MSLRGLTQNLAFKIVVMLMIALTPVGLIAVWQTNKVIDNTEAAAQSALINQTIRDAKGQSHSFQRAFGAAGAIGTAIVPFLDDPVACGDILSAFVDSRDQFTYAHFVDTGGNATCRSKAGDVRDVSESRVVNMLANPKERISWSEATDLNDEAVLSIETPVFRKKKLVGYVSLSVLPDAFDFRNFGEGEFAPRYLLTFNDLGHILTASAQPAVIGAALPETQSLIALAGQPQQVFRAHSVSGTAFAYSVAPAIDDTVYALAIWQSSEVTLPSDGIWRSALIFPLLMLAISVCVAFFAVHRLVIRHVGRLRVAMQNFAQGDRRIDQNPVAAAPLEISDIGKTYVDMAQHIMMEEAEAENRLHEKNVLLKEVHHRVKNNLQLIVSIINMQMRKVSHIATKLALKRVQDRVLGLATVHGNLYQSPSLSAARADKLLSDVVQQLLVVGEAPGSKIEVKSDLDKVLLYPDQAVPFSLLAAEAVTNALKYIGAPDPDAATWIQVSLKFDESTEDVTLSISNSTNPQAVGSEEAGGTGIGSLLIEAFTSQLGATLSITEQSNMYSLEVSFRKQTFQEDI